jgi:hypothetical protein
LRSYAVLALALSAGGCGDLLTKPCGAVGQACCGEGVCNGVGICDAETSVCVEPCASCSAGETRCGDSGQLETCSLVGSCTVWAASSCPPRHECDPGAGLCTLSCDNACPLGSRLCTVGGLKECRVEGQDPCPSYVSVPDNSDPPACVTGACDGAICWESPVPQGGPWKAVNGWLHNQLLLLDDSGNILRFNTGQWSYEHRTRTESEVQALAPCLVSYFLAVGDNGLVLRRDSASWEVQPFPTASSLRGVACDREFRAVATSATGEIFLRNGEPAGTWTKLPSPTSEPLHAVALYYATGDAWAVGESGTIVRITRYDDAALATATLESSGVTQTLRSVASNENGEIFAVGDDGVMLRRYGFGWTPVNEGLTTSSLYSVNIMVDGHLFVGGENGALIHGFLNDYQLWSVSSQVITGVYSADQTHLYAVTLEGPVWFNAALGFPGPAPEVQPFWREMGGAHPTRDTFNAVHGTSAQDVYAVGDLGQIFHRNGDVWIQEAKGLTLADLNGVSAVSPSEVYAVGADGTILARRAQQWRVEAVGLTTVRLHAVWNDGQTVYAVGDEAVWLEKPVGGASSQWKLVQHSLPKNALRSLTGVVGAGGEKEVWAVGSACTAVRKVGDDFALVPLDCQAQDLLTIVGTKSGDLYIGGTDDFVAHRQGGSWTREFLSNKAFIAYGLVEDGSNIWALTHGGGLFVRTNTWRREAEYLTELALNAGYAPPEGGHLFVVGEGGLIWHRR